MQREKHIVNKCGRKWRPTWQWWSIA